MQSVWMLLVLHPTSHISFSRCYEFCMAKIHSCPVIWRTALGQMGIATWEAVSPLSVAPVLTGSVAQKASPGTQIWTLWCSGVSPWDQTELFSSWDLIFAGFILLPLLLFAWQQSSHKWIPWTRISVSGSDPRALARAKTPPVLVSYCLITYYNSLHVLKQHSFLISQFLWVKNFQVWLN